MKAPITPVVIIASLLAMLASTACASKPTRRAPSGGASDYLPSYSDTGKAAGPTLVLVHAFPLNQSMWDGQVAALKGVARVITFDMRGMGQSELPGPYTLEFVVDDLMALLDRLDIKDKVVVCGLSMGGFVALRAIERQPERFSGLILADTKSGADSDKSKLGRYKALKTIQSEGLAKFVDGFAELALSPGARTANPALFGQVRAMMESNSAEGVSAAVLALTSRTDTTSELGKIHVPTLVLQGESDAVFALAEAKALRAAIPGATLSVIPKAGHLSNLENPAAFDDQVREFLRRIRAQ